MNRQFLLNIALLLTLNLLVKPFYIFGIDRTVQNIVGTESYGLYFTFFNLALLLQIVHDFGIQNFNNRAISQHRQLIGKYFPNLLLLKMVLSWVYLALALGVAALLGYPLQVWPLLGWVLIVQVLSSFVLFLRSNISGLGFYRTDSLLSALDRFLLIGIAGLLLLFPNWVGVFQIEWLVYSQAASMGITLLVAFWVLRRHLPKIRLRWKTPLALWFLRNSMPFALVILLMTLYTRMDAVMLERMLPDGKHEAGVYASAYRLLDASNMIGYLFATLLLPMFARLLKTKESIRPLVETSFQLIMAGAWTLSLATFSFREEIAFWLYHDATPYWGEVLGFLMLSFVAVSGSYVFGTLLTANGKLGSLNRLFLVGIAMNATLNFLLIPPYKAWGATVATLATQTLIWIAQMVLAHRMLKALPTGKALLRQVLFAISVGVLFFITARDVHFSWQARFLIGLLGSGLLALAYRLIEPKKALAEFRKEKAFPEN
ncbi:MAG: oligosaccharide flippase family protein [Saprospirales bacterium]|nr:oligosaccharide flippase family protein [Saprospirales bacterium]